MPNRVRIFSPINVNIPLIIIYFISVTEPTSVVAPSELFATAVGVGARPDDRVIAEMICICCNAVLLGRVDQHSRERHRLDQPGSDAESVASAQLERAYRRPHPDRTD